MTKREEVEAFNAMTVEQRMAEYERRREADPTAAKAWALRMTIAGIDWLSPIEAG